MVAINLKQDQAGDLQFRWGGGAQVVAAGSCHSLEGLKLEELCLRAGAAKLAARGQLLGARQDASFLLTDFPVAVLQPLLRALPALEHAAPAAGPTGARGPILLGSLPTSLAAHLSGG